MDAVPGPAALAAFPSDFRLVAQVLPRRGLQISGVPLLLEAPALGSTNGPLPKFRHET